MDNLIINSQFIAAEKVFHGLLCWFPDFWEFIVVELGQKGQRWAHEALGHACPPPSRRALVARGHLLGLLASSQKKISKKFRGIWTSFATDNSAVDI